MIPDFREDGYLPEGLHLATEAEVTDGLKRFSPRKIAVIGMTGRFVAHPRPRELPWPVEWAARPLRAG